MAAASVLGGLLLVPTAVASAPNMGFLPVSAANLGSSPLPVPGDFLRMLGFDAPEADDLGASGKLPEADTLSPDLLAALAKPGPDTGAGPLATVPPGPLGIPGIALEAYMNAERRSATTNAQCGVTWPVLAAIGRIESGHARGGRVDATGTTVSPILGPRLDGGPGIAAISDSDDGRLDGDTTWDRAVGPMQFIPTTWARYATDGNDDGTADPHNLFDATMASANYLCAGGNDLRDPAQLARAIFRYNHSDAYVRNVLTWAQAYAAGVTPLPPAPAEPVQPVGPPPPVTEPPTTPPGTPTGTPTPTTTPSPTGTDAPLPTSSSTTTTTETTTEPTTTTTAPETTSESPGQETCTETVPHTSVEQTPTETTTPAPSCTEDTAADQAPESVNATPGPTSSLQAT